MTAQGRARQRFVRRPLDAATAAIAFLVLVIAMLAVRNGSVSDAERTVFRAVNDLPGALYPVLWPFQQLGAVLVGPILALVAFALRQVRLGVAQHRADHP